MSKPLDNKMNMYATVEDYLDANNELVKNVSRLDTEKANFSGMRSALVLQVANKTQITTGITADKGSTFSVAGNLIISASLRALVWAKDMNNQELAAIFTVLPSRYANNTYAKKLEQAKAVYAALVDNAAALVAYNITDTDIAAIAAAIKSCESAIIAPAKASKSKQAAATTAKAIAGKMDESLITIDNLIVGSYAETAPQFVSGYMLSRKVGTAGVRHTGISATITDLITGKAIENATLTIGGLNKTAVSNMAGLAEIIKMKAGSYHISISAEGYVTQLQDITISRGRVVDLAVALVLA